MSNTVSPFGHVKKLVRERFERLTDLGSKPDHVLLNADYNRDTIWDYYLSAFEDEEERQGHNCNACKSFIRQVGGILVIDSDLEVNTIWDFRGFSFLEEFKAPLFELDSYVRSLPIKGLFYHDSPHAGVDQNTDKETGTVWQHFYAKVPQEFINDEKRGNVLGRKSGELRNTRGVLHRGLTELSADTLDTVLDLIDGGLYRGAEFRPLVKQFRDMRDRWDATPEQDRELLSWYLAGTTSDAVLTLRNSVIGTLLVDLSEGKDVEQAAAAYQRKVAPENYQRTTAIVTPRMIETAKAKLQELGLISALDRRRLDDRDVPVSQALYVYRPRKTTTDVFEQLAGERQQVNIRELDKVSSIGIADFLESILPETADVHVIVERRHLPNFVTLTGPQDPEAPNLMKWDNSLAWSYSGGVSDAIKQRVKEAGGAVDGWLRASLAWHNHDDLDLHMRSAHEHVFHANKRGKHAWLDVDANFMSLTRTPVENMTCAQQLPAGEYCLDVNQYTRRESRDDGYELEVEVNGEVYSFGSAKSPPSGRKSTVTFTVAADGQVTFSGGELTRSAVGLTKWGVKTGQYHRVRLVSLSPNHWTKPTTLKHFMFFLEGCVSDEQTRPFMNEFLVSELSKDRKVMEVLGSKIEVAPAEGAELSGLGFSDSSPNHLFVEVTGVNPPSKRQFKVLFG